MESGDTEELISVLRSETVAQLCEESGECHNWTLKSPILLS